jgi:hypothetical protein
MLQPQEADALKASKNSRFARPIDPLHLGSLSLGQLAIGYWLWLFALRVSQRGSAG